MSWGRLPARRGRTPGEGVTRRLFVAVDIAAAVFARVTAAAARLRALAPDARWSRDEAGHVTLAFLGAVEEPRVPAIATIVRDVAARHRPFVLEVAGAGVFGPPARPRVLWADVAGDLDALAALQADVTAALVPLGVAPEARPFHPHLTLARTRSPRGERGLAAAALAMRGERFGAQQVSTLVLYESHLGRGGARHEALARCALQSRCREPSNGSSGPAGDG